MREEKPKKEKPLKEEKPKKERSKKVREPKENGSLKKRGRPKKQPVLVEPIFPEKISSNDDKKVEEEIPIVPIVPLEVIADQTYLPSELVVDQSSPVAELPSNLVVEKLRFSDQNVVKAVKKRGRPKKVKAVVGPLPSFKEMIKKSPKKEIKVSHNKTVRNMSDKTAAKKNLKDFKKSGISLLALLSEKEEESMIVTANDSYYNSKNPL
jgi:hypothetical protein